MNAGSTDLEVGTLVRITHIADADDRDLVGVEGTITHAFPGLMTGSASQYVAGIYVTPESAAEYGLTGGSLGDVPLNICRGDRFEVVSPEDNAEAGSAFAR